MECGLFWSSLYHDTYTFYKTCENYQRTGNINPKDQILFVPIVVCKIFNVWDIDFMGLFPSSFKNTYILLAVDYSKWVEAKVTRADDAKTVVNFLKVQAFVKFRVPKAVISDCGTHFYNRVVGALLNKYYVIHRISTAYHPQTSRQMEVSNREVKSILEKTINPNRKD